MNSHSSLKNRAKGAQDGEGEKRADIEGVKNRGDDVAEEVEIRIAEVSDGRERLPLPGDVWEPTQQNPNHQNTAVYVKPLPQPRRHNRQRRVQGSTSTRTVTKGSEEQSAHRGHAVAVDAQHWSGRLLHQQQGESHQRGQRASAFRSTSKTWAG